jgi:FMN phosphatase YigB (HAD superfamily)
VFGGTLDIYNRKLMKPILFIDFDGTLCHDRFWRSLEPTIQQKIQANLFGLKKELVRDWMLGKYTSEEINQMLAEELGSDYDTLWSTFVSDCERMFVSQEVLDRIKILRSRYLTVLITDNMDSLDRFTIPALGLDQYFDLIVNSHIEKALKNDENGKSFQKVIEKYQSPISESILIDNSISSCEIFADLGGKSCLVTSEKALVNWLETGFK